MAKAVVLIARLVTTRIQTVTIHRALLVQKGNTVTKCFKLRMLLAKHARRVPIRLPKVSKMLPGVIPAVQENTACRYM